MLCAFVSVTTTGVAKYLTTHITSEWLLTCVNTFVHMHDTFK